METHNNANNTHRHQHYTHIPLKREQYSRESLHRIQFIENFNVNEYIFYV